MGAWSHQPFGNDTAGDWAYGLVEADDLSIVESAIDAVLNCGSNYVDADVASEAVAAVEVLAKLLGRGTQSDTYTAEVDAWVKSRQLVPSSALLQKAQAALARILSDNSELAELWEDGDAESWVASMVDLQVAIGA